MEGGDDEREETNNFLSYFYHVVSAIGVCLEKKR